MPTDAVNTTNANPFEYPRWNTLLGPVGGDPPGSQETFDDAHAVLVVQSASGSRLDFANIEYGLLDYLVDRVQPADFTRMVEVTLPDGVETRLHRGDYVTESEAVEGDGEMLQAQSQLRPYHFGTPIEGMLVYDPEAAADATIPYPVTFNPTVDEQVRFNRSDKSTVSGKSWYWLHGESAWTPESRNYHDTNESGEWVLQECIEAICDLLNFDEEFIDNPDSYTVLSGAPKVRNITLPIGMYLPACLDALLIPLGYNWFVDYGTSTDKPKISLFEIGAGTEKQLWMQAPGAELDLQNTNLQKYTVQRMIGDSFNDVKVYGGFKQYEVTLPLFPAWPETKDEITPGELGKTSQGGNYEGNENVWRLFIANEDGTIDPNATRLGVLCSIPDLSAISDPWVARRRTLEEPLTYIGQEDDEGRQERRPFWLEYADEENEGDPVWQPVPEDWSVRLLPDQIGVYFDGDQPPFEFFDAADNLRLRITGTIMVDERLVGEAPKQAHAVNGRTNRLVLDMPEDFVFRKRLDSGDYQSAFVGQTNTADERDDSTDITSFAEDLRDKNEVAQVDCEFRLPGLHVEYQIGDLITAINGREISLDAASPDAPASRYVQVVERRYEFGDQGPATVLVVDRGVQQA
jgi:hypothetical protein